jgi:hypothetical protein
VRLTDLVLLSVFHQGQKQCASLKVRMYGCNLYQFSKSSNESLAKVGVHVWVPAFAGTTKPNKSALPLEDRCVFLASFIHHMGASDQQWVDLTDAFQLLVGVG